MTESDWMFDYHEVLVHPDGHWWHVVDRLESIDGRTNKYVLSCATHTERRQMHKADVEGLESEEPMFESAGFTTDTKPAHEHGFRVNGVLTGPGNVEYWKGNECVHEQECSDCGADGYGEIDVIHDLEHREIDNTQYQCRNCGNQWNIDR